MATRLQVRFSGMIPPPPGVQPNFDNPPNIGPPLLGVGAVFIAIMLSFLAIRIYVKTKIVKKYSPDDYTCIIAAIGAVGYFIIIILAVTVGYFGIHTWDLRPQNLASNGFLLTGFMSNWFTAVVWPFAKLSFFLLYIQLFRPIRWLRWAAYIGATINVLFYFSVVVATLAFTVPAPGETLLQSVYSPRQAQVLQMAIPIASMSLVLDVYILVLPMAVVNTLQLTTKKKVGLMAVFFTGIIACVASSLSIYFKYKLDANPLDITYETMPVLLACLVEMCVGVTASCMPAMSHLLRHSISFSWLSMKLTSIFSLSSQGGMFRSRRGPTGGKSSNPSSTSSHSHSHKFYHKSPSSEDAILTSSSPYTNIDPPIKTTKKQGMIEMAPVASVRTYIQTSETENLDDTDMKETPEGARGIHLRYRLEQDSGSIPTSRSGVV